MPKHPYFKPFFNRGQINISVGMILAGISFIIAPLATYYSSQLATSERISTVDTKTQVVENRVKNLEEKFDKIDGKLDALLLKQGLNPDKLK